MMTTTNKAQSEAFEKAGAFFAFGKEQFNEKKKPDTKYVSLGAGLICPKDTAETLTRTLKTIHSNRIKTDKAENSIRAIIVRELWNHEVFYTGELDDVADALRDYGITYDNIHKVYREELKKDETVAKI